MPALPHESRNGSWTPNGHTVIEMTVRNHPGVMSHICNLFSRRAYNVEGILCLPIGRGDRSRIWLLVEAGRRLDQMIKQTAKLEDVYDVRQSGDESEIFERLAGLVSDPSERGTGRPA